jgi:hypothetical protein
VQVADEHQDGGPGVGCADADVVQPAVGAQGELAAGVDLVGADPVVGVGGAVAGGGFGTGGVNGGGDGAVGQGAVGPLVVVGDGEGAGEFLQLGEGSGLGGLGGQPVLEGLLEPPGPCPGSADGRAGRSSAARPGGAARLRSRCARPARQRIWW